jgi:protein-tyrosine-phosphatase/predicted ATP-grasp superfamily ATP-dependent carboligase
MNNPAKVLVIGDDTRSFLACVRSLGRQGLEVHVAPQALDLPALASRYIAKVHLLPYYLDGGAEWLEAMRKLLDQEQFDLVLPCEERSLLPLYRHRDEFPPATRLAIPDQGALEAFFDKYQTRSLARQCDVPVARAHLWQAGDGAAEVEQALSYPMVAKHRHSYSWPDLYVRTQVAMLHDRRELDDWLARHRPEGGKVYFEAVFTGKGLGVSVLCHEGEVLQAFEHHRAHELSGSSYYRKSMPLEPGRLEAVRRMVAAIRYTGLAMFEFKLDERSGDWILLEVNARPWGSLPLPVAWGVDFPYRLYRLLCRGERTTAVRYPSPRFNRNLIADLWQMKAGLGRLRDRPVVAAAYAARWLGGFSRILLNRERHDAWVWDDPRPGVVEAAQFLRERWRGLRRDSQLPLNPAWSAGRAGGARPGRPHLLFLCQGNICRSSYAEHKARQLFAELRIDASVESAGMLPRNPRPAPPHAQEASAARGIDLSGHRSQHAHREVIERASWIVVFDEINYRACLQRYPEAASRLVYLAQFEGRPEPTPIADPEGRTTAFFSTTYERIDRCLSGLAEQLRTC